MSIQYSSHSKVNEKKENTNAELLDQVVVHQIYSNAAMKRHTHSIYIDNLRFPISPILSRKNFFSKMAVEQIISIPYWQVPIWKDGSLLHQKQPTAGIHLDQFARNIYIYYTLSNATLGRSPLFKISTLLYRSGGNCIFMCFQHQSQLERTMLTKVQ